MNIISLIETLRPKQWYKNIILFVGMVFSFNLLNSSVYFQIFPAFLIFCLLSGSVYTINDIVDREKDRIHPIKSNRPIASGRLKVSHAMIFSFIVVVFSLSVAFYLDILFGITTFSYFILNVIYTFKLKHHIIADVLLISIFFVIRAIAGCVIINVFISPWLILCSFLLALFLALGKRRNEVISLGKRAKEHRPILEEYSVKTIEQMITITTAILIISYSMYTFMAVNRYMMITIPFIIYGLFRYLHLSHSNNFESETAIIFLDKSSVFNMILWFITVFFILYDFLNVMVDGF